MTVDRIQPCWFSDAPPANVGRWTHESDPARLRSTDGWSVLRLVESGEPVMETLLQEAARYVGLAIEAIAIVIVAIGVVDALLGVARARASSDHAQRAVWLRLARWLIAALTFQL